MYLYTDYLTINSTDIIETEFKNKSCFTNNKQTILKQTTYKQKIDNKHTTNNKQN